VTSKPSAIDLARPLLDLVGQIIKEAGQTRMAYLACDPPGLDDLFLNFDQQVNVLNHQLKAATRL
jgi:hypothetical protein